MKVLTQALGAPAWERKIHQIKDSEAKKETRGTEGSGNLPKATQLVGAEL